MRKRPLATEARRQTSRDRRAVGRQQLSLPAALGAVLALTATACTSVPEAEQLKEERVASTEAALTATMADGGVANVRTQNAMDCATSTPDIILDDGWDASRGDGAPWLFDSGVDYPVATGAEACRFLPQLDYSCANAGGPAQKRARGMFCPTGAAFPKDCTRSRAYLGRTGGGLACCP